MKTNHFLTGILTGILLFLFDLGSVAQVCSSPANVIYGLTNAGDIQPITISTGVVGGKINPAYAGNPANLSNGIGYSTLNGRFYYLKRSPDVAPQEFVSFNPATNSVAILRSCPTTSSINVGCVTNDGRGYYCWDQDGVLYYYNIALNTWTTITSVIKTQSGTDVSAIIQANVSGDVAVDGLGTLIMCVGGNSKYAIYKLSNPPKTAQASITVTEMVALTNTPSGEKFVGIALDAAGEMLLTTASPKNNLYRLESDFTFTLLKNMTGGMGDITSCNFPISILPMSLKDFSAKESEGSNLLTWKDGIDGVNGFTVEYSMNGNDWSNIGYVKSSYYGAGSYSFRHTNPVKGRNYYRLKMEDDSKEPRYSSVKVIDLEEAATLSVWPNPVENNMVVRYAGKGISGSAVVIDQSGRMLKQYALAAGMNTVDVTGLAPGSYFLRVQFAGGESYMNKIIKK